MKFWQFTNQPASYIHFLIFFIVFSACTHTCLATDLFLMLHWLSPDSLACKVRSSNTSFQSSLKSHLFSYSIDCLRMCVCVCVCVCVRVCVWVCRSLFCLCCLLSFWCCFVMGYVVQFGKIHYIFYNVYIIIIIYIISKTTFGCQKQQLSHACIRIYCANYSWRSMTNDLPEYCSQQFLYSSFTSFAFWTPFVMNACKNALCARFIFL